MKELRKKSTGLRQSQEDFLNSFTFAPYFSVTIRANIERPTTHTGRILSKDGNLDSCLFFSRRMAKFYKEGIAHGIQMTTDKDIKTVLVVEEESRDQRVLSGILSDLGYRVIDEPDGPSALSAIREEARVDLVVTDDRTPDTSSLEIIKTYRQLIPSVPVIIITAYASIEKYLRALSLGVFEYINKPVGKRELELIVKAALHFRGLECS